MPSSLDPAFPFEESGSHVAARGSSVTLGKETMASDRQEICRGCGEKVVLMTSSRGDLLCPTCECVFRYNAMKWFVALPVAIAVAVAVIYFGREIISPMICALVSVVVVAAVILWVPSFVIVIPPYQKRPNQAPEPTAPSGRGSS